jgi:lycopene cyclase CruA
VQLPWTTRCKESTPDEPGGSPRAGSEGRRGGPSWERLSTSTARHRRDARRSRGRPTPPARPTRRPRRLRRGPGGRRAVAALRPGARRDRAAVPSSTAAAPGARTASGTPRSASSTPSSPGLLTADELDGARHRALPRGLLPLARRGEPTLSRACSTARWTRARCSPWPARAESLGVVFHDGHTLMGHATGERSIALRFIVPAAGPRARWSARLMIDARGAASPSATADLVCPTVGGVLTGLAQGGGPRRDRPRGGGDPGDHGGRGGPPAAHLGGLSRAARRDHRLPLLLRPRERGGRRLAGDFYARFFATLPRYKRGECELERPTFGYIPGWSRLSPAPRPPSPRIVLVGDAAARQSPLTYCGFGATLRSVNRRAPHRRARRGSDAAGLDPVVHDTPCTRGPGALAHMIASPPTDPAQAGRSTGCSTRPSPRSRDGRRGLRRLLRDEMSGARTSCASSLDLAAAPGGVPWVFRVLGAAGVGRWGAGVLRALWEGPRAVR